MSFERRGQTFDITTTEKWTLNEGGKELQIETTFSTPRGERTQKIYYDKKIGIRF